MTTSKELLDKYEIQNHQSPAGDLIVDEDVTFSYSSDKEKYYISIGRDTDDSLSRIVVLNEPINEEFISELFKDVDEVNGAIGLHDLPNITSLDKAFNGNDDDNYIDINKLEIINLPDLGDINDKNTRFESLSIFQCQKVYSIDLGEASGDISINHMDGLNSLSVGRGNKKSLKLYGCNELENVDFSEFNSRVKISELRVANCDKLNLHSLRERSTKENINNQRSGKLEPVKPNLGM